MKLLCSAILSVILVGCVTASYKGYDGLKEAIEEGRLDIAAELCRQDKDLGKLGVEYVTTKDNPDLIVRFIKQTDQANWMTLHKLHQNASTKTFTSVLERVDFPQADLIIDTPFFARKCDAERFVALLSKIESSKDQENVFKKVIGDLLHNNRSDRKHVRSLLAALREGKFQNEALEAFASKNMLTESINRMDEYITEEIASYPAITPKVYADELIATGIWGYKSAQHDWLVGKADRYDLEEVMKREAYGKLQPWFRESIEKALKKAPPGGTRTRESERVKIAKKVFAELRHLGVASDTAGIVVSYLTGREPERNAIKKEQAVVIGTRSAGSSKRKRGSKSGNRRRKRKGKGKDRRERGKKGNGVMEEVE